MENKELNDQEVVRREKLANKPETGHLKKANTTPKRFLREIRGVNVEDYTLGQEVGADLFVAGEVVDVIGTTKGHGYSGTIKRYGNKIGPKGHGSGYHRGIGSLANNGRCNNRVIPGKTMSGHWGPRQATIQNITVIESNAEKGYILVKGGIPGAKKSLVMIRSAILAQSGKPEVKALVDLKKGE